MCASVAAGFCWSSTQCLSIPVPRGGPCVCVCSGGASAGVAPSVCLSQSHAEVTPSQPTLSDGRCRALSPVVGISTQYRWRRHVIVGASSAVWAIDWGACDRSLIPEPPSPAPSPSRRDCSQSRSGPEPAHPHDGSVACTVPYLRAMGSDDQQR